MKLHVSEATAELLQDSSFTLQPREPVNIRVSTLPSHPTFDPLDGCLDFTFDLGWVISPQISPLTLDGSLPLRFHLSPWTGPLPSDFTFDLGQVYSPQISPLTPDLICNIYYASLELVPDSWPVMLINP